MLMVGPPRYQPSVALRKESVDRNLAACATTASTLVALRKESVDRNKLLEGVQTETVDVALRKESVDRNTARNNASRSGNQSLSARRAWIEMSRPPVPRLPMAPVALRKESVDRNRSNGVAKVQDLWSLSARRAWIEISMKSARPTRHPRRSPQGERG